MRPRIPLEQRFWSKVDRLEPGECWEWTGHRNQCGYGRLMVQGKTKEAHRISWEIHYGEIPHGAHVLHRCDNPACVNPSHLFLGDQKSNVADMVKKNRHQHGETNGLHKLTESDVLEIHNRLESGDSFKVIAREYHMSSGTIHAIKTGRTWGHVTGREKSVAY